MDVDRRLAELGIELPPPPVDDPARPYAKWVRHGDLLYVSGQLADRPGAPEVRGVVGEDVTVEQAQAVARDIALNLLATVRDALGSLDRVDRVVRVLGFVRGTPAFDRHPEVVNGASRVLVDIWGQERGRHARSAIGAGSLPHGVPVEIEMVVAVTTPGDDDG